AGGDDGAGGATLVPADRGEAAGARPHHEHRHAEDDEEEGENHGHVRGAGPMQRAQGEGAALPDREDAEQDEGGASQTISRHRVSQTLCATCSPSPCPLPPWGGGIRNESAPEGGFIPLPPRGGEGRVRGPVDEQDTVMN